MTFLRLIQHLEHRLGHHQVPLNPRARELRDLFSCCALHHELMKQLSGEIYKKNRCCSVNDPVARQATLDAIVPIRLEILRSDKTDIDTFHFIEDFCAGALAFLETHLPESEAVETPGQDKQQSSKIIPFSVFQNRRIKSLA